MQLQPGTAPAQSFDTQNDALAITLHLLGVKWFKNEHGKAVGLLNDYTPALLRDIDARRQRAGEPPLNLSTLPHADAVRLAYRNDIRGNVTYRFEVSDLQKRIVAAYNARAALIAAMDAGEAAETESQTNISPEDAAAVCCQYVKTRKLFLGAKNIRPLWMEVPPFAIEDHIRTGSRPCATGPEHYGEGSYRRTEVKV